MPSTVYFTDFSASSRENLPQKIKRLITLAGLGDVTEKGDITAVKLHFGERGNTAFIRPPYIRAVALAVKDTGALPFLTDANTLYAGARSDSPTHIQTAVENGFSFSSMAGVPLIIADGLRGKSETAVPISGRHCRQAYIGSEIIAADALISVAHFKGHELTGFGGTLKNLGMGCASRKGKLDQHSTVSPKVKRKTCIGCGECAAHCPADAITVSEKKAAIDADTCIGCGECIVRCPTASVSIRWNQAIPVFLEKMVEYTAAVLQGKSGKALFINFINDVSPACDCLPYNDKPIVPDIGIAVSTDPVALDQACADLVNGTAALDGCCLIKNTGAGQDKFRGLYPEVPWELQLAYAEEIGLGKRAYTLKTVPTRTWRKKQEEKDG